MYKFIVDARADARLKKKFSTISRIILLLYLILYACVDHGTYYKFYLKKLKNNTAHLSYTNLAMVAKFAIDYGSKET